MCSISIPRQKESSGHGDQPNSDPISLGRPHPRPLAFHRCFQSSPFSTHLFNSLVLWVPVSFLCMSTYVSVGHPLKRHPRNGSHLHTLWHYCTDMKLKCCTKSKLFNILYEFLRLDIDCNQVEHHLRKKSFGTALYYGSFKVPLHVRLANLMQWHSFKLMRWGGQRHNVVKACVLVHLYLL